MAGNWRIRHKLMLGMALVVIVMALLLVGTLKGLFTFKGMMRAFDGKLPELEKATALQREIEFLVNRPDNPGQQDAVLDRHLQQARSALTAYNTQLNETVRTNRDPEQGYREKELVKGLELSFARLEKFIQEARLPHVDKPGDPDQDLLAEGTKTRQAIEDLRRTANDLVNILNFELSERVRAARRKQHHRQHSRGHQLHGGVADGGHAPRLLSLGGSAVAHPGARCRWRGARRFQPAHRNPFGRRDSGSGRRVQRDDRALREMYANLAHQVNERSRQLVRSERLAGVGFLAAGVAHEINNPLASIAFCSEALERRLEELLRQRPADPEEQKVIAKYLKMIQEEAFRCKEITEKLLAFSRGGERKREQADLAEVVQGVLDVVQHLQNCKGKHLDFDPRSRSRPGSTPRRSSRSS